MKSAIQFDSIKAGKDQSRQPFGEQKYHKPLIQSTLVKLNPQNPPHPVKANQG
jgi:hypothetical protein